MISIGNNHYTGIIRSIQFIVVLLSCLVACLIRLFSVTIHEQIIHEFDPHFNWRCTKYIDEHGLYEFLGWFDIFDCFHAVYHDQNEQKYPNK